MSGRDKQRHRCETSGKLFQSPSGLEVHVRSHTEEQPLKCNMCGKRFTYPSQLIIHKRTHTGEKPFKCETCDKAFGQLANLNAHKRIHTGEKPYKCDVCDKAFADSSSFTTHKRIHTGERPYECDQCNAAFARLGYLTSHKRSHAAEMPHKCTRCERCFRTALGLAAHKRVHTGELPYECHFCGKKFTEANNLKAHERSHTGENVYRPQHYGASFPQSFSLELHQRMAGRTEIVEVVPDRRHGAPRTPYPRKQRLSTRRNGIVDKSDIVIVTEANVHEVEEKALRELYTPAPEQHLGEVKKEQLTVADADLADVYTLPPGPQREEVKHESQDEQNSLCTTPVSPQQNMPAVMSHLQSHNYWPQHPGERFVPSQPFEAHGVAGMSGTNGFLGQPCEAPLANRSPYYAAAMQPVHAPSQAFSQNGDHAGTAPYPPWFEHQQLSPYLLPVFSPYFGIRTASTPFSSTTDVGMHGNPPYAVSLPATTPSAPPGVYPAPRVATPRDLLTPMISERYFGGSRSGSIDFASIASGDWIQTTPGNTFRCSECPYIASIFDLLCGHYNASHRTNDLTSL